MNILGLGLVFFFVLGRSRALDVLLEISVTFPLQPVGKCLKGFHVSSVMLLSELKQHWPCKIRV